MFRIVSSARLPLLFMLALCVVLVLTACGGSDSSSAPPPPPPPEPIASFTAPGSAAANAPVVFDASASSSTDGSTLQYFWDFGDGQRGGGASIARVFASGGTRTVALTVVDGAGRTATVSRAIAVADPPDAVSTVAVQGAVTSLADVALEGVTVSLVGGAVTGITDAMGHVSLTLGTGIPLTLRLAKDGYSTQFVRLLLPPGAGADAYFEATLRERDAALTLADAAAGGVLVARDGARLTLPPNSLVGAGGSAVSGAVQVEVTPVDVTLPSAAGFPGSFDGLLPAGVVTPIVSFGTVEYLLSAGGQALQLATGQTATIEIPAYATRRIDGSLLAAGDLIPLWSLDETTGLWVQEGEGTIVASSESPTGLALRATVSHLSWWNADIGFDPYGPQPRCVYDTDIDLPGGSDTFATATICNLLAEFDRDPEAAPLTAGSGRRAAAAVSPRVAGYSRRAVLPIGGGQTIPVPAGVDIALNATALNGTWVGRRIVNGPVGVQAEELIPMHPLETTGPGVEAISVPFDGTRALDSSQVSRFSFSSTAFRYARITATPSNGSTLTGRVRLLRGTSVLGTVDFGPLAGRLEQLLPADDSYVIEVTALTNAPGAYRLQLELLGDIETDTVSLPLDLTKNIPAFTIYRGSFTIVEPMTVWFAYRPQGSSSVSLRVLAPDGTPLASTAAGGFSLQSTVVTLPAAGSYTLEVAPDAGQAASVRLTAEKTSWQQIAPALESTSSNNTLIDLVADRNAALVVAYTRNISSGSVNAALLMLRRWTGSAWEAVGEDLTIDNPCNSGVAAVAFAFDSDNAPVVAFATTTSGGGSQVAVKRYVTGGWQGLGPDAGRLPLLSDFSGACSDPPELAPGPNGTLAIAYRSDSDIVLQKFDGTEWVGIESVDADVFPGLSSDYDLAADANGRLYYVQTWDFPSATATKVRRLSLAGAPAWELLGPNGGALPETNTSGLSYPRLRFDANGQPVIGVVAAIGSGVVSAGTAVYRYDGTQWSTTGGFQAQASYVQNGYYMGFTVAGSDAYMGWLQTHSSQNAPVMFRNTAAGWTPIDGPQGEIPQYWVHGINDVDGYTLRPLALGSELYLALVVVNGQGSPQATFRVTLLRKVAP